jgi:hypothetical protein
MQLIERIKSRVILEQKLAWIRFYSNKKLFSEDKTLIVCGDPRGGSTWLAETLAELPETVLLWEPLHLKYAGSFKKLGFNWRQHIPADAEWAEAKQAFSNLFRGKVLNEWTLLKANPEEYKRAKQLLVKFCRSNALLPWLCNSFSFQYKPVYLVRHPLAVVASQLKQGGWDFAFVCFEALNGPFAEFYAVHEKFLTKIATKEESLLVNWCLSNRSLLSIAPENRKWIQVTYEEMLLEPQQTVKNILRAWDKPFTFELEKILASKSSTTLKGSPIHDKNKQLSNWKNSFTAEQLRKMQYILDYFEIHFYCSGEVLPKF